MASRPPLRVTVTTPPAPAGKFEDRAERCVRGLCWLVIVVTSAVILDSLLFAGALTGAPTVPAVLHLLGFEP